MRLSRPIQATAAGAMYRYRIECAAVALWPAASQADGPVMARDCRYQQLASRS